MVRGAGEVGRGSADRLAHLLTTAPGSRRPCELAVVAPLLEETGFAFLVVLAGLMLIIIQKLK